MNGGKYKRIKKTIIAGASSGIVAGMILMGTSSTVLAEMVDSSTPAYSQATPTGMHMMRRWNSPGKINSLVGSLGLNTDEIKQELKLGKNLKQILQENGIVPGELHKAFASKKSTGNRMGKRIWKDN